MTITASARTIVPPRADLLTATAALAQITASRPQLDPAYSINKTALDCIYLLIPSRSIKQSISSTPRHRDRVPPRAKSP